MAAEWRFSSFVALGGIQGLVMAFTLARSKIVAVTLGPAGVGAISLIDQIVGLVAQIAAFSLPFAAVKFLSAAHSEGPDRFNKLYASFAWALTIASVIGTGVAVGLLYARPSIAGQELLPFAGATMLACVAIPASTLSDFFATTMAAAARGRASALYGFARVAAITILAGAGLVIFGLTGYYAGALIAVLGVTVGGAAYLARAEHAPVGRPRSGFRDLWALGGVTGFAGSLYVASFAQPAAILVARYAAVRVHGLEGAGTFQAAMALGLALFVVMRQPNAVLLMPRLSRHMPAEDKFREASEYLEKYALIVGAAALPLVLFPEVWLYVLYSRQFLVAAPFAYFFVAAQVLKLFSGVLTALLVGLDEIAAQLVVALIGFAALAWIAWALTPSMGLTGLGIAFLVEAGLGLVLSAWWLRRRFAFAVLGPAITPVAVLALVSMLGAGVTRMPAFSWTAVLVKSAVLVVCGGVGWLWARRRGLAGARAVPGSQLPE